MRLEKEHDQDYEALGETAEEWSEEQETELLSEATRTAIEQEIADLEKFKRLALSIEHNAKGKSLLIALERAFTEAERLGADCRLVLGGEAGWSKTDQSSRSAAQSKTPIAL